MKNEPILAIDIGTGTQDILLYDPGEPMENAVKLVLPSPTRIVAQRIKAATEIKKPVYLTGRLMGGGPVSRAVRQHLKAGLDVYAQEAPALTLSDNVDLVVEMGVQLVEAPPNADFVEVTLGDLDMTALKNALDLFEVPLPAQAAIAVQDHGFSPNASNRLSRFVQWENFLKAGGNMSDLLYGEPPENLTRLKAAADTIPGAWLMDTGAAALRGAILDEYAAARVDDGVIVLNLGNGHTVAALVKGTQVLGVYEHHTRLLSPETLSDHIKRFAHAEITNEEVFNSDGHGVAYNPEYRDLKPFEPIIITGPRRGIAKGLGHMAAPYGEMMLSGCFGLIEAVREASE